MSKSLSLNLDDDVLREVDAAAHELWLRSKLQRESGLTASESMLVLKEFEEIF